MKSLVSSSGCFQECHHYMPCWVKTNQNMVYMFVESWFSWLTEVKAFTSKITQFSISCFLHLSKFILAVILFFFFFPQLLSVYVFMYSCMQKHTFSRKISIFHIHTPFIKCIAWLIGKCLRNKQDRPRKRVDMDKGSGQCFCLFNVNGHTFWDWLWTLYKLPRINS